jgi:hypothetical protein
VDSKIVSELIRRICWPLLRKEGFTDFSSRTARRMTADRIELVNFQSLNSEIATAIGCTTFSFGINLGVFLTRIPGPPGIVRDQIKHELRPEDYHCHLRRKLRKTYGIDSLKRDDLWSVTTDGSNAEALIGDAVGKIEKDGLAWFTRYQNSETLLALLHSDDSPEDGTWGYGALTSPARRLITGYVHLMRGERMQAVEFLSSIVDYKHFSTRAEAISVDIEEAR